MPDYNYSYSDEQDTLYCYPDSRVLKNRFNIRDKEKLAEIEREITAAKILQLRIKPIKGQFDLSHLQAIHKFIFGDIYTWAGEVREGDFLAKGNSIFCRGQFIIPMMEGIHRKLKADDYLRKLPFDEINPKLAYYMGEINALHPFREGNGRTQREFFYQLISQAGYELDFSDIEASDLLQADIAAFETDYNPLISLLNKAVKMLPARTSIGEYREYINKTLNESLEEAKNPDAPRFTYEEVKEMLEKKQNKEDKN